MENFRGRIREDLLGRTHVNIRGNQGTNLSLTIVPALGAGAVMVIVAVILGVVTAFLQDHISTLRNILHWGYIAFPIVMLIISVIQLKDDFRENAVISVAICLLSSIGIFITERISLIETDSAAIWVALWIPLLITSIILGILCRSQFNRGNSSFSEHIVFVELTNAVLSFVVLIFYLLLSALIANDGPGIEPLINAIIMIPLTVGLDSLIFAFSAFIATLPFRILMKA